jgi:sporulation protein YlmC with PRC-barrel domain
MKMLSLACTGVLATLAGALSAQEQPAGQEPKTTTVQVKSTRLQRIGADVVGVSLVTPANEPLGKVEDVILHPKGDVSFLEVSGTGALRTGSHRFAVPWHATDRNDAGQFTLAIEPANFPKMPHYEKAAPFDMEFWLDTDRMYSKITGEKASPAEAGISLAPAKRLYTATDVRSRTIESAEGEKLATVKEIVVDPKAGRIAYLVLGVGGSGAGGGEKSVAVPWEALKVMPDKENPEFDRFTLATTMDQLQKAPEFQATTEGWAKANEPAYIVQVYEFYSLPPYAVIEVPADEGENDK